MSKKKESSPQWVIGYDVSSPESKKWAGTHWEFFDTEEEALACYRRQILAGNSPFKRPYKESDKVHLVGR